MKKILLTASLFLYSCSAPAFAQTSTINPNIPANNSNLTSSVLRANYLAAYNDINALWAALNAEISAAITSLTGDVTATGGGAAAATVVKVHGVSYPASPSNNTVPVITGTNTASYEQVPNAALANPSLTIAGHSVALGGTQALACSDLTGSAASCSTDTTNASNISSGTLGAARLPAFTGDVTSPQGSSVNTLATVNSNVGSFGSSTAIPNFTVNGKGLLTAAGTSAVIAPAGTLTGTTLASSVVSSSLTSVGTIATGVWNGTAINLSSYASGTLQAAQEPAHTGDVTNMAGSLATTVGKINGVALGTTTATAGNLLVGSGSAWVTQPVSGDCSLTSAGALTCTKTGGVAFGSLATLSAAPAGTLSGTTLASNVVSSSLTSLGTLTAPLNIGTPSITDTGVLAQLTSSIAGYNQVIVQNTNSGTSASANILVQNNLGTSSTYYGEFGMNSGSFTGSGAFNQASTVYVDSQSGDLALGTLTANKIHFVVNNGSTDAVTIGTTGNVGIGTSTPNTSLHVNGGITVKGRTLTSGTSDTATTADYEVRWCLSSGAVITETIPACNSTNDGFKIIVTDECGTFSNTNTMTVSAAAGTILKPSTSIVMNVAYQSLTFHCDGGQTNYTLN